MALLLAFSFFGQLVADIISPIEYRRARLLSQPLWLAVYLYTAAFLLVIIFNKLESSNSRKYFKFITMRSERATPSVTMKSDGTTPKNSLKRVDDDEDTSSEGNVIRRIHYNPQQTRWISCDAIRSFSRNLWLFCVLAFLDAICFEAFVQNSAIIYQQKFNMGI